MARVKGFRTLVLEDLRTLNGWSRLITSQWQHATRIYDRNARPTIRRARPDELPENNVESLRQLAEFGRASARMWLDIAEAAEERANNLPLA